MNQDEKILRDSIKKLILHVKDKKRLKENKIKDSISSLVSLELKKLIREAGTPDVDPAPNKSTGINVLEELLKKIIPILETDYKSLTTDSDQRQSFRSHIINAVIQSLTPAKVNNLADPDGDLQEINLDFEIDEDIGVEIGDAALGDDDKFIDIRSDAEIAADDEEEEEDPRDSFGAGVEGDETGRNVAYQSFKKIESNIIDSYELLSNPDDQELFYDYIIANLKLYFDKFETELSADVSEPSNQAYNTAKQSQQSQEMGTQEPIAETYDLEI